MFRTALTAVALLAATGALAQEPPFGSQKDQDYAARLWDVMTEMRLAGDQRITTLPYEGVEPHGFALETLYGRATLDGHSGDLVVKRNYGPEGVAVSDVQGDRAGHLAAVTVMFRREDGFDPGTGNWFWAKYLPDGSLDRNPAGVPLAGLVGKGAEAGCIACHSGAAGEDMLYTTDALD